jgi:hypothetical protein
VAAIRQAVVRPSVSVIGVGIEIGLPLTRMVEGRWVSAYCSDWLGGFAYFFGQTARETGDVETANRYERILNDYIAAKRAELDRERPDLLLIQKNDKAWLGPMFGEFGFDRVIADYRFLAEGSEIAAYVRIGYKPPQAPEG